MRILLAVDGSGHSEAAVDAIVRQQFPSGSEVRIISVAAAPYFPTSSTEERANIALYVEFEKASQERANLAVEKAAATLRADEGTRHLKITTEVLPGLPKQALLEAAEAFGADLIVVGSHGHGKLERFLMGSVAQAVALHATCSVEIVRRSAAKTADSK
jgi:nucleotide-binding universal stress UspA family protein